MTFTRFETRQLAPAALAMAACAALGAAAALRAPGAAPLVAIGAALACVSLRWRSGVIVLLATLPFAGIPVLLAGAPGHALRDVAIVLPLYAAFAVEATRTRAPLAPPYTLALAALAVFAALVVAGVAMAPTAAAGAIGAKVWLAYVPMLAVGYRFVRGEADLERALRLTALVGLVPAALGLVEFALAATQGDFGPFEALYGAQGVDDDQRFVIFTTSSGAAHIPRVLSTFTSVTQYYGFVLAAYACALALALRTRRGGWAAIAGLLALATMAAGVRAAYVAVPALTVLAALLAGPRRSDVLAAAGACALALVGAMAAGVDVLGVAGAMPGHFVVTLHTAWSEFASSIGLLGHGTGWDTNAALRYGGVAEGRYVENWYAKAALELGLAGLAAIALALAALLASLVAGLRRMDAGARALAAPLVALLAVVAVSLFKGPYIDLDPLNVYFWLFAGMVAGMARAAGEDRT